MDFLGPKKLQIYQGEHNIWPETPRCHLLANIGQSFTVERVATPVIYPNVIQLYSYTLGLCQQFAIENMAHWNSWIKPTLW